MVRTALLLLAVPLVLGAVLLGVMELLYATGHQCFGLPDYPGSEYYCEGSLGPTNDWLADHFFVLVALGTGAACLLAVLVRQLQSS